MKGRWLWLTVFLPWLLPGQLAAQTGYTLTGALGMRMEKYDYERAGTQYRRDQLRKEPDLGLGGHVWDPRFMRFNLGVNLRQESTTATLGDSEYRLLGYNLNTTWLTHRRNPISLYTTRSRTTTSQYTGPDYELETRTLGARWGLDSKRLGAVRFSAERMRNLTDGRTVQRDETSDRFSMEGTKRGSSDKGATFSRNYGYRYNTSRDDARGTTRRQHHLFANERTTLSPTTTLSSSASYNDRHDVWSGPAGEIVQQSRFFAGNASINLRPSERLRHNWSVTINNNQINEAASSALGVRGGLDYTWNERWQQHASVSTRISESRYATTTRRQYHSAESGVRYNTTRGNFNLRSGYALGVEQYSDDTDNILRQSFNAGYSRSASQLWRDNAEYRLLLRSGASDTTEHNLRYSVNSRISDATNLNGSLDLREYTEHDRYSDRKSSSQRLSLAGTQRLQAATHLAVNAGLSRHQGSNTYTRAIFDEFGDPIDWSTVSSDSQSERRHIQARLTKTIRQFGNVRTSLLVRREEEERSTSSDLQRNTVEGDLNYNIGKWQFQLQYRLRETSQDSGDTREQRIVFYGRRNFGMRF